MKILFFSKGLTSLDEKKFQEYMMKKMPQLEKLLTHFADDAVNMHIHVQRFERNNAYRVELVLKLPSKSLKAREDSHSLEKGIELSKDRLLKQLKKHEEILRGKRKGKGLDQAIGKLKTTHKALQTYRKKEDKKAFQETIKPLVENLTNFVKRELFYTAYVTKKREKSLKPESIVDEVVLGLYESFNMGIRAQDLEKWMYTLAVSILENRAKQMKKEQKEKISLDDTREHKRIKNYFLPEELATFEEKIWDGLSLEENPRTRFEQKEQHTVLMKALSSIPRLQRQTFTLSIIEKFSPQEIAKMQKRKKNEVENDLQQVKNVLFQKMQQEFAA